MSSPSEPPLTSQPKKTQFSFIAGDLNQAETFWRDRSEWLKEKGYILRSRYQPGWVPSWRGNKKHPTLCPDGKIHLHHNIMDATRVSDGSLVVLKIVNDNQYPHEIEIAQALSLDLSDKHNHCVPILDVFPLPDQEGKRIMVTPYLHRANRPDFDTIGEAIEFCRQIIEGLAYIHKQGMFHGDAKSDNVLMDGACLFLTSFHPLDTSSTADCSRDSKTTYRTEKPVKYYFIDYDLAEIVKPGDDAKREGPWGGDKSVPEFKAGGLHDPFAVDVYCLGNIIRETLVYGNEKLHLKGKKGFNFLRPLVDDMCQDDPERRPKINEVVDRFAKLQQSLSSWTLRSRIISVDENPILGIPRSVEHWTRRMSYIVRGRPAIPSP